MKIRPRAGRKKRSSKKYIIFLLWQYKTAPVGKTNRGQLSVSITSIFSPEHQSRGSAHSKAFAAQTHPNRGRVPRFGYFEREKVSAWELSDVRVLQSQNTDCRKNEVFRQSHCPCPKNEQGQLRVCFYRPNDFIAPYISGRRSRNTPHEWRISRMASRSKVCVSTPSFSRSACSTSAPVSSAMNDEP